MPHATSHSIERVTNRAENGNDQLLYFTSSSLIADDSVLVFLSDRTKGNPNLFVRDLHSGMETQLTRNSDGVLKSYVYFSGTPYRGFGKASVSLHAESGTVYYIQGRELRRCDLRSKTERTLAVLPVDQMTAFTHVSADGTRVCVPTVDARVLDGDTMLGNRPEFDVDERVRTEGLCSWLRVYDTSSGKEIVCEPVPGAWVTHVQFSPIDATQILYNHEWTKDSGVRRMWLFDGREHIRLRNTENGRRADDWTCHEMWERDGSAIIYHGVYKDGLPYIGRVYADGTGCTEIPLTTGCARYGHFTVGSPGALVTDGYYETPDDPERWAGNWISSLRVDWERAEIVWSPLCRSGSTWRSQDEHPHPIFDHAARFVYFTSDWEGSRAVYRVGCDDTSP